MIRVTVDVPAEELEAAAAVAESEGYEGSPEQAGRWLASQYARELTSRIRATHRSKAVRIAVQEAGEPDTVAAVEWTGDGLPLQRRDLVEYDGEVWETIQAHTTQADWSPPVVPALFRRWRDPEEAGEVAEWATATAYEIGDRVTFNGATYRCIQAHTSQDGWEPTNVPALWVVDE
ncbi:MAG: hypothetical protein EA417_02165 [Gammaproteobacteria bacterium]|nr:MAG: hypothetical protein EA417_02165 [Gammaproteobacteria bacterium]